MHPFAEWTIKNTKYRKVAAVAMDYAFGYETVGGFQHVFEEQGGQIVQKIWVPLNTNDFAPFVAQIRRDADAVLVLFTGRLALQFLKQYQEAGLQGKLPILSGGTTTDESVLPSMGDEALGVISALHYSQALDLPANQKFAKAFEAKAGKISSYYSEATLHEHAVDRRGHQGRLRQGRGSRSAAGRPAQGRHQGHARADRSRSTPTATPSRTSTCARSSAWAAACRTR